MTEEKKKEYLKKNFVQPLSASLPLSCDYFMNSGIDQCISINENFANYINFDLKSITQDYLVKTHTQSQAQNCNNIENNNGFNFSQREFDFELVNLKPNSSLRNPLLKLDQKIEFNIQRYCEEVDQIQMKEVTFRNSVRLLINFIKHFIYQKNYKKIILHDELLKFKIKNSVKEKSLNLRRKLDDMLLIDDFSDFCFDSSFGGINYNKGLKENFRNDSQYTPSKKSKMSKVISELLTSTSIKNVFEDNYSSQQIYNVHEDLEMKVDKEEKLFERNSPIVIKENDASSIYESQQYQMINKELQENIKK